MADLRPLIYKQYHSRGKQWQTTPKNLPRMQRARGIPVAWLGSGSCQNRPKDWIQINQSIITVFIYTRTFVPQDLKFNFLLIWKRETICLYRKPNPDSSAMYDSERALQQISCASYALSLSLESAAHNGLLAASQRAGPTLQISVTHKRRRFDDDLYK
jgi:hypothetical protein